ncbi:response regulator [candidate division WWE3 bacterium]|uniref:Response regulator n=1 Tax=candidate division WWE3 bacterium TaxID=2053526 RepID=A0A955LLV3_UNCKA|nr:response regulator [candidate division WWE3 bacterium]
MDKKILIIEDEPFILETYSRELEKTGYQIDTAVDGTSGLDKSLNQEYDLILLDIMLPEMNGIDILREIKKNEKASKTPVILLTNLGQESVVDEAFKLGAQGYILKINALPTQLVKRVSEFFETGKFNSEDIGFLES